MGPVSPESPLTSEGAHMLLAMFPACVEVKRGMGDQELDHVEERWGFRFAPEHRTLLSAGLPMGSSRGVGRRKGQQH